MTTSRTDAAARPSRPRRAHVTAVVVTRGRTPFLARTLAALAAQTAGPDAVVVVDAAASPEVDRADLPTAGPDVVLTAAPAARTFGDAVRSATGGAAPDQPRAWLWLLHDDSAPEPSALAELLRAVEVAPSVAVAGCKQWSWDEPTRVLEVGVTTSRFGRRMTGLEEPEVDQGQHDAREDVLGVGTAGALVRRDVWDALGGTDPALGPYGDGLDLSRRARLAGHRVVVVPTAVVRHAQASLHGGGRPGWDARRSTQARREAFLHAQLVGAPAALLPALGVLALVSGLVRAVGRLVTKEPHLVTAELAAPLVALARPGRVAAARRRARAVGRVRRRALRPLQATWRDVVRAERDRRLSAAERRRAREAPSELELAELAALRTRRRGVLALVVLSAVALTGATLGGLVTRVVGGSRLVGGSLTAGDAGLTDLWRAATTWWVPGGLGSPGPADPFLAALLPVVAVTGNLDRAQAVLVLGSLVLAAVGAWAAAGAATRSTVLRAWAALAWTAAPPLLVGVDEGRFGAVTAHVLLPWVVLGVARAVGVARIDAVASGLVGARHDDEDLAGAEERPAVVSRLDRAAEPSLAAAAAAGLAFAATTAAAPVLLPAGLVALLLVAVVVRRRRRLAWVAVPALVLHGPVIATAARTWDDGGWRALLGEPGRPLADHGSVAWQQLLGWPVAPGLGGWADAAALAGGGTVAVVALLALAAGPGPARAVRTGWLVAACGLAAGVVATRATVAVAQGEVVTASAGPGTSLALAGLLVAGLAGAGRARSAITRSTFGWRQVGAAAVTLVAVLGPVALVAGWSLGVRPGGRALAVSDVPDVPAVGTQLQTSPDDLRVLRLTVGDDGTVHAALLRGDGRQLTELSRLVTTRAVEGPWDAPTVATPDAGDQEVAAVVAALASGTGAPADALAGLGVGAVVLPAASGPADETAAPGGAAVGADGLTDVALASLLDSTPGLERVTQTAAGVLWRVSTQDRVVAWARLVTLDDQGTALGAVAAQEGSVDTQVGAGPAGRVLVLAERADAGWRATLDGRPLRVVPTSWRQAFELGPDAGRLVVTYDPVGRDPWLAVTGVVLAATALLALPVRRRRVAR